MGNRSRSIIKHLASCGSVIMFALGIIGILLVPLLPYSGNFIQFSVIMSYMAVLILAFTFILCGIFTESKMSIGTGLMIALVAFVLWLVLTVPTLVAFRRKSIHDFCLGLSCGESHWMIPRQWKREDFADADSGRGTTTRNPLQVDRSNIYSEPLYAYQQRIFQDIMKNTEMDSQSEGKQSFPSKENMQEDTSVANSMDHDLIFNKHYEGNDTDNQGIDKEQHGNVDNQGGSKSNQGNTSLTHSLSKRFIPTNQFPIPHFLGIGKSYAKLNNLWSMVFALVYLLLFSCVLGTIIAHLASFSCKKCCGDEFYECCD